MLAPVALACLAIGAVLGYSVASRIPQQTGPLSNRPLPEEPLVNPAREVTPAPHNSNEVPYKDPMLEEMRVVLIGLLSTLTAAVEHIQEGSDRYTEQLDSHRTALKETMAITDLRQLGAALVHQVEAMYEVNSQIPRETKPIECCHSKTAR